MNTQRINDQIKAPQIRLVNEQGEQLGVVDLSEAKAMALEAGLDLVEISPNAQPPVVKLIGFDKFRYQQKKMEQQQKKKAKKIDIKVLRISARIGDHDLKTKAKKAEEFLQDGDLVKLELRMRGREQAFADNAMKQMQAFMSSILTPHRVEVPLKRMGNTISTTIAPTK